MTIENLKYFLLNYSYKDVKNKFEIYLYAISTSRKPVKIIIDNFRPLFFVSRNTPVALTQKSAERKALPLKSMDGNDVDCLYFNTYSEYLDCTRILRSNNCMLYESDIQPVDRYLMERFINGGFEANGIILEKNNGLELHNPVLRGTEITPALRVLSLDIETNAYTDEIYSIACHGIGDIVFIIGQDQSTDIIRFVDNEKSLLKVFFDYISENDPDIIIGWSIIDFDLRVIQERCQKLGIQFTLGRDTGARIIQSRNNNQMLAKIPGRVVMDIPLMLRSYYQTFEEYSLNFVASQMLNKTKTIELTDLDKIEEINRQFREDKFSLATYNLQDTILAKEIFDKAGVLPNAIERTKQSGHLLDRTGGSVAAFDYLYLPRLHREGYVAKDLFDILQPTENLPGGYVLEPVPGLYENVVVFDFRSLYPSIIMTFKIDPLGLISPTQNRIKGPVGPSFSNDKSILPEIINRLMDVRAQAKRDNNPYLSQSIKILMNSFYGVLGSTGCRFFSSALATTITRTGQYILKQTIEHIESVTGFKVIYGDTDSLFVYLGNTDLSKINRIGLSIAEKTTIWLSEHLKSNFNAESALKLEYQTHFRHFFMPAVRGASHGSKKHYCGSLLDGDELSLVFKGMESARSDWTDLAKDFQQQLFLLVFNGKAYNDFIIETVNKVRRGEQDHKLIYKKRLRKEINEYTVHIPPHAQAAKLLDKPKHIIRYYITTNGPEPIEKQSNPIDYNHYIESQLRPVADSILEQLGTNFDKIVSGQQDLFG
jgi:DNA polymerase-2